MTFNPNKAGLFEGSFFLEFSQVDPLVHSTLWKYSTSWKCSLHFVYVFRTDWNFLTKFCISDPSFSRNILSSLYLKFKTSAHAYIVITNYYVLFTNFLRWSEFWGYIMENEVGQWFYQLNHVNFSEKKSWSVNYIMFFYQIYFVQISTL